MANTLTGLIPIMYKAMDKIRREMVGFIPAVDIDAAASGAALNQVLRTQVAPDASGGDITPGQLPVDDGDQTIGYLDLAITKSKYSPIRWAGEEIAGYQSNGNHENILADQFAQSIRYLVNLIEADIGALAYGASRVVGTPGTTPFGTAADLSDVANLRKILEDNGCPMSAGDLSLILDSSAAAVLRGKHSELFRVNEGGDGGRLLRDGALGRLMGFDIGESAQVAALAQIAATSYATNGIQAAGATGIVVKTGTAAISKGAIISFAGDTANKYVVAADYAGGAGTLQINKPGLRVQIAADNAITVNTTTYRANIGFHKNAIKLLTRTPYMPDGGDAAMDVYNITDPVSGLTFQVAQYGLYRRIKYEIGIAWGVGIVKNEFIGGLAG